MDSVMSRDGGGKDQVILQTKEDEEKPFNQETRDLMNKLLDEDGDDDQPEGPLKANGEINWSCPCMANMVAGPCGYAFREAFSCFHYSKEDPKGAECVDKFRAMSECFQDYPTLYPSGGPSDDNDDEADIWKEMDNPESGKNQVEAKAENSEESSTGKIKEKDNEEQ